MCIDNVINVIVCIDIVTAAIAGLVTSVLQNNPRHSGDSNAEQPAGGPAGRWQSLPGWRTGPRRARANFALAANKSSGRSLLSLRRFNGPGVTDSPGAAGQRGPT